MTKRTYRVLRRHDGDRMYDVGDTREGEDHELQHLVPLTLQEISEKAEREHANKAERVSRNKARE